MPARRTIVATLAAVALIAPAASQAYQPPDMHASTALAAAKARAAEQPKQDLRSPDARDAVTPRPEPRVPAGQPTWPVHPVPLVHAQAPAGQPTWPVHPVPLVVHAQAPASSHDDGSPITLIALIAGGLLALTAVFAARHAVRRGGRHTRVAA